MSKRVRAVLDGWKADTHPYTSEEVKQLIAEVEKALAQDRAEVNDREEPLRDWGWT